MRQEARYGGTNCSPSPEEVAEGYKSLWKKMRTRSHVMICFLALRLERALRIKALGKGVELRYHGNHYLARTEAVGGWHVTD